MLNVRPVKLVSGDLFGVPFEPNLAFRGAFGGSCWAQGVALGSLLRVLFGCWGGYHKGCQQELKDAHQLAGLELIWGWLGTWCDPPASNAHSKL